jgi:hypothetical protein
MKTTLRSLGILLLMLGLALPVSMPAGAESPKSDDEVALEQTEGNVLQIRRKLFQARQIGDDDEIKELQKQFDKAQKERVRLLRKTWQM